MSNIDRPVTIFTAECQLQYLPVVIRLPDKFIMANRDRLEGYDPARITSLADPMHELPPVRPHIKHAIDRQRIKQAFEMGIDILVIPVFNPDEFIAEQGGYFFMQGEFHGSPEPNQGYIIRIINNIDSNCMNTHQRHKLNRPAGIITSLLVTLILLGACGKEQNLPQLTPGAVILAFGDSLTYGTGAERGESYPARLQELIRYPVINAGKPGELSAAGLERLPALLDKHKPELLILCHGGNDILRKKEENGTGTNIRKMIHIARDSGVSVMMMGVPKPGIFLKSAEFYDELAEDTGVYYLRDLVPEVLSDNRLKSDPVHPNGRGYALMAETIARALKQGGAL